MKKCPKLIQAIKLKFNFRNMIKFGNLTKEDEEWGNSRESLYSDLPLMLLFMGIIFSFYHGVYNLILSSVKNDILFYSGLISIIIFLSVAGYIRKTEYSTKRLLLSGAIVVVTIMINIFVAVSIFGTTNIFNIYLLIPILLGSTILNRYRFIFAQIIVFSGAIIILLLNPGLYTAVLFITYCLSILISVLISNYLRKGFFHQHLIINQKNELIQKIEEVELNLKSLSENSPLSILVFHLLDLNKIEVKYINNVGEQVLGYKSAEITKDIKLILDKVDKAGRKVLKTALFESAREIKPLKWVGEYKIDEKTKIIEFDANPIQISNEIIEWICFFSDVTIEKQNFKQYQLLDSAVKYAEESIIITDNNLHGGPFIVFVNNGFTKLTGYSFDEAVGKNPKFLQGPLSNAKDLSKIRQAIHSGNSIKSKTINYTKEGKPVHVSWTLNPVIDTNEKITNWVSMQSDITKDIKLQQSLIHSQNKFKNLVLNTDDIIFTFDKDFICKFVNPATSDLTGYSADELIGKHIYDILIPKHKPSLLEAFNKIQNDGGIDFFSEVEIITKSGVVLWLALTIKQPSSFLSDNEVIGQAKDITFQKKFAIEQDEKITDLEIFHQLSFNREIRMIELKEEINSLLRSTGKDAKYDIQEMVKD